MTNVDGVRVDPAGDAAGPTFALLRQSAASLIEKADDIARTGTSAPLSQEWQGVFATARTVALPESQASTAVAAFGLSYLGERAELLARLEPAERARAQTLAAAIVELRANGQIGAGIALAALVAELSGDEALTAVLPFFVCLGALTRTRQAHDRLGQGQQSAAVYWRIALDAALSGSPPRLLLACGLSGSGKSFVGAGVAAALGARVVGSDTVRKQLAGLAPTERTPAHRTSEVYSGRMSDRVYNTLLLRAEADLLAGRPVLLDATYLTRARRGVPLELAARLRSPAVVLWCELEQSVAEDRLRDRAVRNWTISEADARIRRLQRQGLQRPDRSEGGAPVLRIDTGDRPTVLFERLLPRVRRALRLP